MLSLIQKMSLRIKLIFIAMVSSISALLVISIVVFIYDQYSGYTKLERDLRVIAKVLADRSVAALDFGDSFLAKENLRAMDADKHIQLGCVYDRYNQYFTSYAKSHIEDVCPKRFDINYLSIKNWVYVQQGVFSKEGPIGTIIIYSSIEGLNDKSQTLLVTLFVATLLALILAFTIAHFIQNIISRPIRNLQKTIRGIQESKNFSLRAEKDTQDELGDLVDAFNEMLIKIDDDNEALLESERTFRTLAASSPMGVFQTNPTGHIVYANHQWFDMFGLLFNEHPCIDADVWLEKCHSHDRNNVSEDWNIALKLGDFFKVEFRLSALHGRERTVVCEAKALKNEQDELLGFVGSTLDVSDLKAAQNQLAHLALYDPLTKLANRFLLKNRLDKAIKSCLRDNTEVGLMFLDVDNFKRINDTMGHDAGDELLKIIAERIKMCVRDTDTVARLGGDEFIILLKSNQIKKTTDKVANHLLSEMKKPINIHHYDVIVSVSVGITIAPEDGDDSNILMKNADLAMFQAKALGKDNYHYFSEDLNAEMLRYLSVERELRIALERKEFFVIYQSKLDIKKNKVTGFEALLRWRSDSRGIVLPKDIIPVAEDTGLILPVGEWVIQTVCSDITAMLKSGVLPQNGRVAINLSVKQLMHINVVEQILKVISNSGVNPKNIEFEITETILMQNIDRAIQCLNILKDFGITITIDDFGTGYSSLSYLKRLPIDYLKIDQSFVDGLPHDTDDVEITSAIIAMSHKLGLLVVAEGVETQDQLDFLKRNRCDFAQGYLFGAGDTINDLVLNSR